MLAYRGFPFHPFCRCRLSPQDYRTVLSLPVTWFLLKPLLLQPAMRAFRAMAVLDLDLMTLRDCARSRAVLQFSLAPTPTDVLERQSPMDDTRSGQEGLMMLYRSKAQASATGETSSVCCVDSRATWKESLTGSTGVLSRSTLVAQRPSIGFAVRVMILRSFPSASYSTCEMRCRPMRVWPTHAMAEAAEYGLMLWDGKSKGTVNNVVNLSRDHKPVVVYVAPTREFRTIKTFDDLNGLLAQGDSDRLRKLSASYT